AREELLWLNIESCHLYTWTLDEDAHMARTIKLLEDSNPLVPRAIQSKFNHRHRVNRGHQAHLQMLYGLHGFTG
ncbi:hypothetical protein K439DRAFT_1282812, partial [Ramaria rubella]